MGNLFSENRWTGEFFLPNAYNDRFVGEIHYSPETVITLAYTITGLNVPSQTQILYGVLSNGDHCTLIGQFTPGKYAGLSIKYGGFTTRSGKSEFSFLVIGDFLAQEDKFSLASFSLTNLQEFFFPKGFKEFIKFSDKPIYSISTSIAELTVRNKVKLKTLSHEIDAHIYTSEKIALEELKQAFMDIQNKYPEAYFMFKDDICFQIFLQFISTVNIQEVFELIMRIADFFALLFYRPVYPDSIYLTKSDSTDEQGKIELYSSMMLNSQTIQLATEVIYHQVMPITRKTIPLDTVLFNWLNMSQDYSMMISKIQNETGFRDEPTTYGEIILYVTQFEAISNKAGNEKMQKIRYEYPLQKYSCNKINAGLAKIFKTSTLDEIAIAISDLRNEIVHTKKRRVRLNKLSHLELVYIAQYLQMTIIGYILTNLGVPQDVIVSYQEKYSH